MGLDPGARAGTIRSFGAAAAGGRNAVCSARLASESESAALVHGVIMNNDAARELCVYRRACHAQAHVPNRDAAMVLHVYYIPGCCILNLPAVFARA